MPQEANYYVPINKELIDNVIPTGNEVIYSTNMFIQYNIRNATAENRGMKHPIFYGGLAGGAMQNKLLHLIHDFRGNYNTDVLITCEGIALNLPSFEINKKGNLKKIPPSPQYMLWKDISFSKKGTLTIASAFNCKLNRFYEFETEENFVNRQKRFYQDVTDLRCSYTAECLKKARASLDMDDKKIALEWIERGLKSNVYRSEFDYFDELSLLHAQIVKEETENKRKMVEEINKFLLKYLQSNAGKAFTVESLMKRLADELDDQERLDYLKKNTEGILNRLTFNGQIQSNQHQGRVFFFF